LLYLLSLFLIN